VGADRVLDGAASREHGRLELLQITAPLRQRRWPLAKTGGTLDGEDVSEALPVEPAAGVRTPFGHRGCHWSAPYRRATLTDAPCASARSVAAPMMREKTAWCSQRGVALINIAVALFAQPGTTLMRPACNARIPARTTGAGCIMRSFNAGVIFCCAAVANPVSDIPGHSTVTMTPSRLSSR